MQANKQTVLTYYTCIELLTVCFLSYERSRIDCLRSRDDCVGAFSGYTWYQSFSRRAWRSMPATRNEVNGTRLYASACINTIIIIILPSKRSPAQHSIQDRQRVKTKQHFFFSFICKQNQRIKPKLGYFIKRAPFKREQYQFKYFPHSTGVCAVRVQQTNSYVLSSVRWRSSIYERSSS